MQVPASQVQYLRYLRYRSSTSKHSSSGYLSHGAVIRPTV